MGGYFDYILNGESTLRFCNACKKFESADDKFICTCRDKKFDRIKDLRILAPDLEETEEFLKRCVIFDDKYAAVQLQVENTIPVPASDFEYGKLLQNQVNLFSHFVKTEGAEKSKARIHDKLDKHNQEIQKSTAAGFSAWVNELPLSSGINSIYSIFEPFVYKLKEAEDVREIILEIAQKFTENQPTVMDSVHYNLCSFCGFGEEMLIKDDNDETFRCEIVESDGHGKHKVKIHRSDREDVIVDVDGEEDYINMIFIKPRFTRNYCDKFRSWVRHWLDDVETEDKRMRSLEKLQGLHLKE